MTSRARQSRRGVTKRRTASKGLIVLCVVLAVFVAGAVTAFAFASSWLQDLPNYENASAYNTAEKTKVYANDGTTLLAEFYLENREPVELNEICDYVLKGTVATEDERFYDHNGVDFAGIVRAVFVNLTGGHEGASTITQQFVRNTVLADEATESTLKRKVREAYISTKLEEKYSKDEILLMYLNTINYGQGAYGIEAASQLYFSKHASELNLVESATLIGIPQSPTYNNPIDNPEACKQRRNLVLGRMLANNVITQAEYDEAQAEPLELNVTESESSDGLYQYKYFTSYVRDTLIDEYSVEEVFQGGMKVITTLDVGIQQEAEAAADAQIAASPDGMEVALVAVDPDTGFIKALIGGKDYNTDEYNLATQARRQPGSSFKTFTLLAALNKGISPTTNLNCQGHVTIDGWQVENYGGSEYGTRTISSAFAISSNTGFAQLVTEIGAQSVVDMAHKCGIETNIDAVPSVTLGAEEVTVREMAQAYATIANGGTKHEAVAIQQIYDSKGKLIHEADTKGEKVLSTELTQAATEVMEGVITNGTGMSAAISNGQPVAGKTGTSENLRDKWFCGITPQLSVAIWSGHREETSMTYYGECDGIFGNFMSAVLAGQKIEQFPTSSKQLTYTIFDIGNGSNSGETAAPEHEGGTVTTTTTTTTITTTTENTEKKKEDSSGGSATSTDSSGSGGSGGGSSGSGSSSSGNGGSNSSGG